MNKQIKIALMLTLLITSTITIAYADKPEEPNLTHLVQDILDYLTGTVNTKLDMLLDQPIRHEITISRLTTTDGLTYDFLITCDKPYELANVYLGFYDPSTDSIDEHEMAVDSLGLWYNDQGGYKIGSVHYYDQESQLYSYTTNVEVLSAVGAATRPLCSAGTAIDVICVLWEPYNLNHDVMPDGDETFNLKFVILAPSDAIIETYQYPIIPP